MSAGRSSIRRAGGRTVRTVRRLSRALLGRGRAVVGRAHAVLDPPDGERALRRRLLADGAARVPRPLDRRWTPWVNTVLRSDADVEAALTAIADAGLPAHGERTKNWDLVVALGLILERVPRTGAVLEMGAPRYARLLPWLFLYGFRRLHGIDLVFKAAERAGPIRYDPMDLTKTSFEDGTFDAIAALSVVEHGVDLEAYLSEASRLLRPGGLLITSTDYWCEPVDTGGQEAYGVPIRIFGPAAIEGFVATARSHGLETVGTLDLSCGERVVEWKRFGLHYTFVNVVLEKSVAGSS